MDILFVEGCKETEYKNRGNKVILVDNSNTAKFTNMYTRKNIGENMRGKCMD